MCLILLTRMTVLRIQLLEPDKYPYLYKCLYGLLMLLPQSSAFAALKNRLNSVSAIALLHTPPPMPISARPSYVSTYSSPTSNVPAPGHMRQRSVEKGQPIPFPPSFTNSGFGSLTSSASSVAAGSNIPGSSTSTVSRLAGRREPGGINTTGEVKWSELLDKFKGTQEKTRRRNERLMRGEDDFETEVQKKESKTTDASQEQTGRTSRASGRQSFEPGRPSSRLSIEQGRAGPGIRQPLSAGAHAGQQRPSFRTERSFDPPSASEQTRPGNKSKYSLTGRFGIRSSSKDKDKDKSGGSGVGGTGGSGLKR